MIEVYQLHCSFIFSFGLSHGQSLNTLYPLLVAGVFNKHC